MYLEEPGLDILTSSFRDYENSIVKGQTPLWATHLAPLSLAPKFGANIVELSRLRHHVLGLVSDEEDQTHRAPFVPCSARCSDVARSSR